MTLGALLAVDWHQSRRRFRGRGGMLVASALGLGGALFLAAELFFLARFLAALDRAAALAPSLARLLLERVIGAGVAVLLAMLLTSGLVAALGSFFRAEDLDFHLQSPLPLRTFLAHRFLRAAVPTALPSLLLLAPLVVVLADRRGDSLAFGLFGGTLAMLLALAVPAVLAPAATTLLAAMIPIRLATRLVFGASLLLAVGGIVALRVLRPERLASPLSALDLAAFSSALEIPGEGWSPAAWLARVLVAGPAAALPELGKLALLATLAAALASTFVAWLWPRAWTRSREKSLPEGARPPLTRPPSRFLPVLSRPTAALVDRELRFFVRDASRFSQIALLAGLLAVYVYNLKALAAPDPLSRLTLFYVDLATIGFVLASLALRFALPAISSEAGGIVVLRAAPVSAWRIVAVKLVVVALPSLLLALGLVAATAKILAIPSALASLAFLAAGAMGIALPALALGAGARFPRYDAGDAAELAVSPVGIAVMLVALAYIAAATFLACRPLHRFLLTIRGHAEAAWERPLAIGAIVVLSLVVAWWPLSAGCRALGRGDVG